MTTWYAQLDDDDWDAVGQWNDQADGLGNAGTPVAGDTCDLNGNHVTMNIATIPATGTLAALRSPGTDGRLIIASDGTYTINATTITGGSNGLMNGMIYSEGLAVVNLTVNGNLVGSSGGNQTGVLESNGSSSFTVNGNVTAGGSEWSYGILVNSGSTLVVNGNVTGGTDCHGVITTSNDTITINGNVTGGGNSDVADAFGLYVASSTSTVTINGNVIGGSAAGFASGVNNQAGGSVTVVGNIINTATNSAIEGPIIYNPAVGNYTQYIPTGGGTFKQYREDATTDVADVRSGTTFWTNGASAVGTLAVTVIAMLHTLLCPGRQ